MESKKFPQLCDNKTCTGCMACVNSCNKGALLITQDEEGFYRPHLNAEMCVKCGLCESACPIINPVKEQEDINLKVYAAWHKDAFIRAKSTSGGAFSALAEVVLNQGGVVFGAAYTDDLRIEHIEVTDEVGLEKLRLSKYAQSYVGKCFTQVKTRLKEGRPVMFVGTPCQVAGLKNFLHEDYNNLLLVDFICHGVPSIDMLQSYLHWLEERHGKVSHINFRDKRKGWYDALRVIKSENGKEKVMRGRDDNYWVGFSVNNNLQESCYHCLAQVFPRCSDITIADFWGLGQKISFGYKEEIEKGVSMIAVYNNKALHCLKEASTNLFIMERTESEMINGNKSAIQSSLRPKNRDSIYKDLSSMDYGAFSKKYMSTTTKQKLVKLFREYFPFSIIKYIRLLRQK